MSEAHPSPRAKQPNNCLTQDNTWPVALQCVSMPDAHSLHTCSPITHSLDCWPCAGPDACLCSDATSGKGTPPMPGEVPMGLGRPPRTPRRAAPPSCTTCQGPSSIWPTMACPFQIHAVALVELDLQGLCHRLIHWLDVVRLCCQPGVHGLLLSANATLNCTFDVSCARTQPHHRTEKCLSPTLNLNSGFAGGAALRVVELATFFIG